jgi:hypothetical protein
VSKAPRATALARQAAETVRSLNHAALGPGGLRQPADAYDVLGDLSLAASRLSYLLTLVGHWLAAALDAGQLGTDDGTDPAGTVTTARAFLASARGTAAALARDLSRAQQQLSAVHGTPEREPAGERS